MQRVPPANGTEAGLVLHKSMPFEFGFTFGAIARDSLGTQLTYLMNLPFRVVGVMQKKGQDAQGRDQDDVAFAPYTTVQKKILGRDRVVEGDVARALRQARAAQVVHAAT